MFFKLSILSLSESSKTLSSWSIHNIKVLHEFCVVFIDHIGLDALFSLLFNPVAALRGKYYCYL